MKAILVFIDGTICDESSRYGLIGTPEFHLRDKILGDRAVPGSIDCLNEIAQKYEIVYIGARPEYTCSYTREWLEKMGYPKGSIYLAKEQEERLNIITEIKNKYEFIAGIGDRWDDNELHLELGCLSIILQENAGRWDTVAGYIEKYHRLLKKQENQTHLRGKVEGLARVCPLLLSKYGDQLWETYFSAVMKMAEDSRETREEEDLKSFMQHDLDPTDLRDVARWDALMHEEDWENNSVYGLQTFELVEARQHRYVHKVTNCHYAELWKIQGRTDIGYQIHCRTDMAWWDRPAWNSEVRFEQPKTLMKGDEYCLFIQFLPEKDK